jgi:hypothetical protein
VDLIFYGQAGRGNGAVLRVLFFWRLLGYVPCKVVDDGFSRMCRFRARSGTSDVAVYERREYTVWRGMEKMRRRERRPQDQKLFTGHSRGL